MGGGTTVYPKSSFVRVKPCEVHLEPNKLLTMCISTKLKDKN